MDYVSADENAWNMAFDLLEAYSQDEPLYRDGVRSLAEKLTRWNEENMADIGVDQATADYINRMLQG